MRAGEGADTVRDFVALVRPQQWVKNLFVLAPLVFSRRFFRSTELLSVAVAFAAFCLASSAAYILNDVLDRERDRGHPLKCKRPLAAGTVTVPAALALAAALAVAAVGLALSLSWLFVAILAGFLLVQVLYSTGLKTVAVVDVATIALLFVLRAAGGVAAVEARMSPWLFLCTFLLAMLLGLGKRRHELTLLEEDAADHRDVLDRYSVRLLDQLISVVAVATVVVYCIYTVWPSVEAKLGTGRLYYTVPFVVLGVFRYLYLVYAREEGGSPTDLLLGDMPLQIGIAGWIVTVFLLLYF